jgi:predicted metalloprotease with PDZ domain
VSSCNIYGGQKIAPEVDMKNQYPLKYSILYILAKENGEIGLEDIMKRLKPDFGNEKQLTTKQIQFHLDSFVCVDMARTTKEEFDENGALRLNYIITPFGMERTKFLPDTWKKDFSNRATN